MFAHFLVKLFQVSKKNNEVRMQAMAVFLVTFLTFPIFADVQPRQCLGFAQPPNNTDWLLPGALDSVGLPSPTCADVYYYAAQSSPRYPRETYLLGSGSWVCRRGIGEMYGDPRWLPSPITGRYGNVSLELFDRLFHACVATVANGGCTEIHIISLPDSNPECLLNESSTLFEIPIPEMSSPMPSSIPEI